MIYFTTVFGFSVHNGNSLGNWMWGFNVIAVILCGVISDRLRVRKPVMVVGGGAAAVMMVLYLRQIGQPTSYYHLAVLSGALAFCLGVAYVPWIASFTETVEARSPALTATGLAVWGWIARTVVFGSYLVLPVVVHSVTPLVTYGTESKAYAAQYAPQVAAIEAHPAIVPLLADLQNDISPAAPAHAGDPRPELPADALHQFPDAGPGPSPRLGVSRRPSDCGGECRPRGFEAVEGLVLDLLRRNDLLPLDRSADAGPLVTEGCQGGRRGPRGHNPGRDGQDGPQRLIAPVLSESIVIDSAWCDHRP